MTLKHLILLRHGQTDWNVLQRMQGHTDIPLNEIGRRQALAAAPSVAALGAQVVVASDLSRAQETAGAVTALTGQSFGTDVRLRETGMGEWEGLTRSEVVAQWPDIWQKWRTTSAHASPPGGESRWQVALRAKEVVTELEGGEHTRALLVAHGGLIVGLTGLLLNLPDSVWSQLIGINNCHWVVLHKFDEAWRLHSYNAGLEGVVIPGQEDEVAGA